MKEAKFNKNDQKSFLICDGFTLVEILIAIALIGVISAIAMPMYKDYVEKTRVAQAITDIRLIALKIKLYQQDEGAYPVSLDVIGASGQLDPWGRAYEYLNLTASNGNGGARRDKNLNPLNSDFDLYSKGKNGVTKLPISQKDSLDDVLRANDGTFVDLASKY